MGKSQFKTLRVAEDGAIWATKQEPGTDASKIFRVQGSRDLQNKTNYGEYFEADNNKASTVSGYSLKGNVAEPNSASQSAFKLGKQYGFAGQETISLKFEKNMNKFNIPKDVQNKIETEFGKDNLDINDAKEVVDAYRVAQRQGRDMRYGTATTRADIARKGLKEYEKYDGIFDQTRSGKRLKSNLWDTYGESRVRSARKKMGDAKRAEKLAKQRTTMVEEQAKAWENKNKRDFERTVNKGRDTRSWTARSWSKITGRKPGYLLQAEAILKDNKAQIATAEAARLDAENAIKAAKGKGGYTGTKAEVRIAKLQEKVDQAEKQNNLLEEKNRTAVVGYQKALIARRRQANDAAGYFQKTFLKRSKGSYFKPRKITENDIRNWERMSRFQEDDKYFTGVASAKGRTTQRK